VVIGLSLTPAVEPGTINIVLDNQAQTPTNFFFTGNLDRFYLDDPATDDGDAYTNLASFEVAPGTYTVRRSDTSVWLVTGAICTPEEATTSWSSPTATITVGSGEDITCTFTINRKGWITARVFNDLVRNGRNLGRRNAGDPWLAGWTISVYSDPSTVVATDVTELLGTIPQVRFRTLSAGDYTVCIDLPEESWTPTSPDLIDPTYGKPCKAVTVNFAQGVTLNFGAYQPAVAASQNFTAADEVVTDVDNVIALPAPLSEDEEVDTTAEQVEGMNENQLFLPFIQH
jgi:hypothetical protein